MKIVLQCIVFALLFFFPCFAWGQDLKVTGKVVSNGAPLAGVSVIINGTSDGTFTDIDGTYSLHVPNTKSVIRYSFLGYQTEQRTAISNVINVDLKEDALMMGEVVVLGYGSNICICRYY